MQARQVALLALVAIAAVAMAQRCNMPQQWEARQIRFDPNRRYYHNQTSQYSVYARYSYDGLNKRKFRYELASFGDQPEERLAILELYNSRQAYVTNISNQACVIYPLDYFNPHDIPANAIFDGYEILGSGTSSLTLSQWTVTNATFYGGPSNQYLTFTSIGCLPVRDDHFNNNTGFSFEEFSDVTLGFHDPNIWIPPANCRHATLEEQKRNVFLL